MTTGIIRTIAVQGTASAGLGITAEVTVSEQHSDDMTITLHPVERGAAITDHAFKMPAMLNVDVGFSAYWGAQNGYSSLSDLYTYFLNLQASASLLEVQTGKRLYSNLLIKSLKTTTDQKTEHVLNLAMSLQEVILVDTITTKYPPTANQANPQVTSATVQNGTKSIQQVGS
jgi:hypothetical protein